MVTNGLLKYEHVIDIVFLNVTVNLADSVLKQCDGSTLTIAIKENNMKYTYTLITLLSALLIASISFAGYHYDGHSWMMSTWDMTEMDSNQDKMMSLEEYSDSYQKSLSESFNMIDTNQDSTG
jgi:hypothetical protein